MADQSPTDCRISRRKFMTAAGLGGAATVLGAITISSAEAKTWDSEVDVIVVGSGGAAFAGATGALQNGASVTMLEKASIVGGTTAKSGGGCYVPNNDQMKLLGIQDSREDWLRYCARTAFPELYRSNDPMFGLYESHFRLLESYWNNSARIFRKLDESGAMPVALPTVKGRLGFDGLPTPDYLGHLPEAKGIRGRSVSPRKPDGSFGIGSTMIASFRSYVEGKGVKILTEHRVVKIIQDQTGRVVGVTAKTSGGDKTFRAKRGVIFGSGGFTHNKQMASNFLRTPIVGGCAVATNEGDLVLMASEVGAKLGNMNEAWNMQCVLEEAFEFSALPFGAFMLGGDSMIVVNKSGMRMYDETFVYSERARSHQIHDLWMGDYPNLYQIMIFDEAARKFGGQLVPAPDDQLPAHIITGNTLEALTAAIEEKFTSLADRIGPYPLNPSFLDNLRKTIARYNELAISGIDTDFHRGEAPITRRYIKVPYDRGLPNHYMAPISDSGPYYAWILGASTLDTKGGPVYNEHGQVVNVHDKPIPGLYAAGNCGSSPSGKSYFGGGATLGSALTFGYLAGEHAATHG
jgi:3-oxosteroid 1-dehydrogenase